MNNYWLLYNPKTMKFYPYGGNGLRHEGSSREYVEKAVDYINQLESENKRLKEQLKQVSLSSLNSNQLNNIKAMMEK